MTDLLFRPAGSLDFWGARDWAHRVYHPSTDVRRSHSANSQALQRITTSAEPAAFHERPAAHLAPPRYIEGLCISASPSFACAKSRSCAPCLLRSAHSPPACASPDFRTSKTFTARAGRFSLCWLPRGAWPRRPAASQRRWSFYHAGVLILLYADLMILAAIVVLWPCHSGRRPHRLQWSAGTSHSNVASAGNPHCEGPVSPCSMGRAQCQPANRASANVSCRPRPL